MLKGNKYLTESVDNLNNIYTAGFSWKSLNDHSISEEKFSVFHDLQQPEIRSKYMTL